MKFFVNVIMAVIISCQVFAQTSIGFKNPKDIQPVLDYRLPDWGYSTLETNFYINGAGNKNKEYNNDNNFSTFRSHLRPIFRKYLESENNVRNFYVAFETQYNFQKETTDNSKDIQKKYFINSYISAEWDH